LIDRACAGDVAAYESLVRRYQDVALRTAYLVAPEADAADAVQDAFLKAYDALPRFRRGAPLVRGSSGPWLTRLATAGARLTVEPDSRCGRRSWGRATRSLASPESAVIADETSRRPAGRARSAA
jgi:RNA polymerase sigma-70 factor (ECF subfamily)